MKTEYKYGDKVIFKDGRIPKGEFVSYTNDSKTECTVDIGSVCIGCKVENIEFENKNEN
jgi:hypothetical protein